VATDNTVSFGNSFRHRKVVTCSFRPECPVAQLQSNAKPHDSVRSYLLALTAATP
jgi:hypothetical protein